MHSLGVVYLYRFSEGEEPVRRFVESYRVHPAGIKHDLIVLLKGFPDRASLIRARQLFAGIAIYSIQLDDAGYDIGSYVKAARLVEHRRLFFLNTFSYLLADNWLAYFDRALNEPHVGLAGATGSWAANTAGLEATITYIVRRAARLPGRLYQASELNEAPETARRGLRAYLNVPLDYLQRLVKYGRYPNPHLRTNAFIIDRDLFLSLQFPKFVLKQDAHMFESSRASLTKQVMRQNLDPVVVGGAGKVYPIADWKASSTFRIGTQENLIVADNRTDDYAQANLDKREYLERLSWVHPLDWYKETPRAPAWSKSVR